MANPPSTSLPYTGIDLNWTCEEQAVLEAGLDEYSSESSLSCYVKIASVLKNKTVRDVAIRRHSRYNKESAKRRKEDHNGFRRARIHNKEFVDMVVALNSVTSHQFASSLLLSEEYGSMDDLFQENEILLNSICANLKTSRISENFKLLSQCRTNIETLLNNLNENVPELMKHLPPLPEKLRIDKFDSILQPPNQP